MANPKLDAWSPDSTVTSFSSGGGNDYLWEMDVKSPSSSVGAGAKPSTNYTKNNSKVKWDASSVSKLEKDYGTGEYSTAPGLTAFDTSPVFVAQNGKLADKAKAKAAAPIAKTPTPTDPSTSAPTPSSRPYIWKYQ